MIYAGSTIQISYTAKRFTAGEPPRTLMNYYIKELRSAGHSVMSMSAKYVSEDLVQIQCVTQCKVQVNWSSSKSLAQSLIEELRSLGHRVSLMSIKVIKQPLKSAWV